MRNTIIKVIVLFLCFGPMLLKAQTITPQEYIDTYKLIAIREMHTYKIPASITLAQGLLESGIGNSKLAREANNHFGIKCHKGWEGKGFYMDDDEENECFRVYENPEESYRDHSLFLATRDRYAFLFDYKITDYKSWAKGLKKAGYATDPKYPTRLIDLIERYDLAQYDKVTEKEYKKMLKEAEKEEPKEQEPVKEVSQDPPVVTHQKDTTGQWKIDTVANPDDLTLPAAGREIKMHHNIKYVEFRRGDNLEKIAKETGISIKQLYKYNDLDQDTKLIKGDKIYLQPKRGTGSVEIHVVDGGETLWEISQRYGIKLSKLYKRNQIKPGTKKVKAGTKLWLKGKKPLSVIEEERKKSGIHEGEIKAD
jgi:LysM repeat protein